MSYNNSNSSSSSSDKDSGHRRNHVRYCKNAHMNIDLSDLNAKYERRSREKTNASGCCCCFNWLFSETAFRIFNSIILFCMLGVMVALYFKVAPTSVAVYQAADHGREMMEQVRAEFMTDDRMDAMNVALLQTLQMVNHTFDLLQTVDVNKTQELVQVGMLSLQNIMTSLNTLFTNPDIVVKVPLFSASSATNSFSTSSVSESDSGSHNRNLLSIRMERVDENPYEEQYISRPPQKMCACEDEESVPSYKWNTPLQETHGTPVYIPKKKP